MGQRGDHARRLTFAERLELQLRVRDGRTFEAAALALGRPSELNLRHRAGPFVPDPRQVACRRQPAPTLRRGARRAIHARSAVARGGRSRLLPDKSKRPLTWTSLRRPRSREGAKEDS